VAGRHVRRAERPSSSSSLRLQGARGALWQGVAYVTGKSVVAITTIVLARMLVPQEFGLVALATVFVTYVDVVADLGVGQAVIYFRDRPGAVAAATVCSTVVGALFCVLTLAAAPAVGAFFDERAAEPLVRVLAWSLFFGAVGSVAQAVLRRDLRFRTLGLVTVAQSLTVAVVSIVLVLQGRGPVSLVVGTLAGAVVGALVAWTAVSPHRGIPWSFSSADVRAVLGYGLPLAGGVLLAKLVADVDYLIVGRELGTTELGIYTLAFRVPEMLIVNVFFVLATVTFPLYTRAGSDPPRLRRGYLTSVRLQSTYGLVAGAGLAVTAGVSVPVVLGERWAAATVPMALLAGYAAFRSLGAGANDVYKAMGRPRTTLAVAAVRLAVLTPVLIVSSRWGIVGIAAAQLICAAVFSFFMQSLAVRLVGLSRRELLRAMAPGAAAAAGVTLACLVVLTVPTPAAVAPDGPVVLAVGVVAGVAGALTALRWAAPGMVRENLMLLRTRRTG